MLDVIKASIGTILLLAVVAVVCVISILLPILLIPIIAFGISYTAVILHKQTK